jgi:hypothetical protein
VLLDKNGSTLNSDNQIVWNIIDLQPGETKTIEYLVQALNSGSFVSQAYVEAHALDGSGEAQANVATRVDIGGTAESFRSSDWQPPACFGLNNSQPIYYYADKYGKDWMACETCGVFETNAASASCASCTSSSSSGYDIP